MNKREHKVLQNLEARWAWTFLSPFIILFLSFRLFPICYSFYMSFISWNGMGQPKSVGWSNYINLFKDQTYLLSLRNTLVIWSVNIIIVIVFGFILALILNSKSLKFRTAFRTIFYLPQALAVIPVCLTFSYILEFNFGFLNLLFDLLGLSPVQWLLTGQNAMASIIGVVVWRTAPWHMVILLAGLQGISNELFEAAELDGCSFFKRTLFITIPMMKPIFFYCFLMGTISSFQIFQEPYVITNGGPGVSTTTISLYMYKNAFEYLKLGYGSSITFLSLILIMILSTLVLTGFRSEL